MRKQIPDNIKADLQYYKFEPHFRCPDCGQFDAFFTYMKCARSMQGHRLDSAIYFLFNCSGCGNNFDRKKTYQELRELYFGDPANQFWKMFYLASWHDGCFQYQQDKAAYVKIITRLNTDDSGWRGVFNKRKYA